METYYKTSLNHSMTCGVKDLLEEKSCYWLMDAILSYQMYPKVRKEAFQSWKLSRVKKDKFLLTCDDGNGNILAKQSIPFSDFPDDTCNIWLCDKVLLLPSEY